MAGISREIESRAENGQIMARSTLTDMQLVFVDVMASGATQTEAARQAGYSSPGNAGYHLMRLPHIAAKVRAEILATIGTEGVSVAWQTLKEVMQDKKAPAAARVAAADKTLKVAGLLDKQGKGSAPDKSKPISEWTVEELENAIGGIERALDNERNTIDVTPESTDKP